MIGEDKASVAISSRSSHKLTGQQEEVDKLGKVRTKGRGVLAARVGLVFIETSVKKLNPEHVDHFLHRALSYRQWKKTLTF